MSYVTKLAKDLGIPIKDARHPLAISVTKHDVVNALKKDSKRCALSRAVERLPGVIGGYFFKTTAYLRYEDRMVYYLLPPSVQKEIVSFDRSQIFAPNIYQLSPPGNLKARNAARNRADDVERARVKRVLDRKQKASGRTKRQTKSYRVTLVSGDPVAADAMDQMVAATQRALSGKGRMPGVAKATKQTGVGRRTLVVRSKYVRDMRDPDSVAA